MGYYGARVEVRGHLVGASSLPPCESGDGSQVTRLCRKALSSAEPSTQPQASYFSFPCSGPEWTRRAVERQAGLSCDAVLHSFQLRLEAGVWLSWDSPCPASMCEALGLVTSTQGVKTRRSQVRSHPELIATWRPACAT